MPRANGADGVQLAGPKIEALPRAETRLERAIHASAFLISKLPHRFCWLPEKPVTLFSLRTCRSRRLARVRGIIEVRKVLPERLDAGLLGLQLARG